MEKKKKNNVKKVAVVSTVAATLFYLYNRAKIEILNIDQANKVVDYKVTLGLKTIQGKALVTEQTNQEHNFGSKKLMVTTHGKEAITLKIVDKAGKQLDYVEVGFNQLFNTGLPQNPKPVTMQAQLSGASWIG